MAAAPVQAPAPSDETTTEHRGRSVGLALQPRRNRAYCWPARRRPAKFPTCRGR